MVNRRRHIGLGVGINSTDFGVSNTSSGNPPVNTATPVISGSDEVDSILSCTTGTWINGVDTYSYQWKRGVTNIGTNSPNYTQTLDDVGGSITCTVTATNGTGSNSATSNIIITQLNPLFAQPQVLLDFVAESSADFTLTGVEVDLWKNRGVSGIEAVGSTSKPDFNSSVKCLDFNGLSDFLQLQSPVILPCDNGWSMLIGFKQITNDRYLFGSSETTAASLFMRGTNITFGLSSSSSRIFNYSGWDTQKTGRAILEITHLGVSGVMEARLNNGILSNGNGGVPGVNDAFFNQIGMEGGASFWNGQIGFIYLQNKPFTASERASIYAEKSAIYVPE